MTVTPPDRLAEAQKQLQIVEEELADEELAAKLAVARITTGAVEQALRRHGE